MLSNKKIFFHIIFLSSIIFISCGDKEPIDVELISKYNDPDFVLSQAKQTISEDVKTAFKGTFDKDSVVEIAAGEEIADPDNWGIKFYLLKLDGDELEVDYETHLLEGSFNECLVQKIKFPSFDNELIYYSSQDYFLGSGGGEVFSYIINFGRSETYYAHLFTDTKGAISLYLSGNINEEELKNFFISNFKRDYPALQLVSNDVKLEF